MENIQHENQNYSEFIGFIDTLTVIIIILLMAFFAILTRNKPPMSETKIVASPPPPPPKLDSTIVIRDLKKRVLFEFGSAIITKEFERELDIALNNIQNDFRKGRFNSVQVAGHTDNKPISPNSSCQKYIDNWDLGAARAAAVVRYFTDPNRPNHLKPTEISATSFGEFRPVSRQSNAEGDAQNRRIEITLIKK